MNTTRIKTLVVALLFGFTGLISATNTNPTDKKEVKKIITTDVQKLLKDSELALEFNEDAVVKIMINKKNEIVVLSVDTKNDEIDTFVKGRLNYKKVSVKTAPELFTVPVKLIATD